MTLTLTDREVAAALKLRGDRECDCVSVTGGAFAGCPLGCNHGRLPADTLEIKRRLEPQPEKVDEAGRWYRIPSGGLSLNCYDLPAKRGDMAYEVKDRDPTHIPIAVITAVRVDEDKCVRCGGSGEYLLRDSKLVSSCDCRDGRAQYAFYTLKEKQGAGWPEDGLAAYRLEKR